MVIELVFKLFLYLIKSMIELSNVVPAFDLPDWGLHFTSMFIKCLSFFPFDIWSVLISNILLWIGIHFIWSIIEWIYIKIPGVN